MKLSQINIPEFLNHSNKVEELYKSLNNNKTDYPRDKSIIDLFHEICNRYPEYKAIVEDDHAITYEELDKRSNQVANFLISQGVQKEKIVVVYMEKSITMIVSILGILKAGGAYCPLNTDFPIGRIKYIVTETQALLIISESKFLQQINNLLWECDALKSYLCVDVEDIAKIVESRNELMDRELWEYVGQNASDDISGGGWSDSYTGELLSREILDEYGDNILKKVTPYLDKTKKVLEIGCASGISMFRIAPHVDVYFGTDISQAILDYDQKICDEKGITNVQLRRLEAEDIDQLEEKNFDLVIINSVVQAFSGHNYLKNIIGKIISLLSDNGTIFIGDIMDQDSKDDLIDSLLSYKKANTHAKTKLNFTNELFVSKRFFEHLVFDFQEIENVEASNKIHTIKCELTEYRYDVILSINKNNLNPKVIAQRQKEWFGNRILQKFNNSPCAVKTSPEQLAYVIFTSGSSGTPKGVLIEQRGVVRLVRNTNFITFTPEDRVSQCIPISFDPSVWEIFGALLNGATLCLMPQSLLLDFDLFASYIIKYHPTIVTIPAALFVQIANLKPTMFLNIETVVVGGEALSPKAVSKIRAACPDLRIINAYGPTENTVKSTTYTIKSEYSHIPIGKPIANSEAYILDENNNLQPIGIAGELCVAGDGLARGYLNDEKLTQNKFVKHPFKDGRRIYKTGDLARLKSSGDIEFLGRLDDQVKIRGYRIELSEIESKLKDIPQIEEAVISVVEKKEKYLCAYLKLTEMISMDAVRSLLSVNLPAFMIPAYYVLVDKFPLTLHGKIDIKALPEPEELNLVNNVEYVGPTNELETKLIKIWEELLERSRVGINDNFFEIGGHSLKAVQLTSRISEIFEAKLEIKNIFDHPTVEKLAKLLSISQKTNYEEIQVVAHQNYYDVSHAQKRLWILDQIHENQIAYNIPSAYTLKGKLNRGAFEKAFEAIVNRHDSLRTNFVVVEGEAKQVVKDIDESGFKISYLDLSLDMDKEERAKILVDNEANTPFSLNKDSLIRMRLIKLEEEKHIFLMTLHHIISDGWSMNILINEFLSLYQSICKDEESTLSPLKIQYKDFAAWQNNQLKGDNLQEHKDFWLNYLSGDLPKVELPTDYPRPAVKSYNGDRISILLDKSISNGLKELSQQYGSSLFMSLIASVKTLIYQYTHQKDIIIGSPVAGRANKDLENQIGFYINTLTLRTILEETDTFESLLSKVKTNTLEVFQHEVYPFDKLVEDLNVERELSLSPLFDVAVVLQNADVAYNGIEEMAGITIEGLGLDFKTSIFDVLISFNDTDQGLFMTLGYNTDLFNGESIRKMLADYERILEVVINNPLIQLNAIDYLGEEEKKKLLIDYNQTESTFPAHSTIQKLFEQQAERTPDSVAVVFRERKITYQELNEKSNQLAHTLRDEFKLKPDDLVCVCLNPSDELIYSIFGVLKAGAAYIPIDAGLVRTKKQYMIEDSQASVIITSKKLYESDPEFFDNFPLIQVLFIEEDNVYSSKITNPFPVNKPEDLCYVIYTSGTTGKSKGAMVEHKGLVNYTWWAEKVYVKGEKIDFPLYTSISFDLTVTSIFTPLISGNSVVIYEEDDKDLLINKVVEDNQVDIVKLTPSHLKAIKNRDFTNSKIKRIIIGGEELETKLAREIYENFNNNVEIFNEYGPTETVVGCMIHKYDAKKDNRRTVPIGVPSDNVQIYVLNEYLKPVGTGIPAEIYIAGDGVARGYLNKRELTLEKFVSNPFKPGARMYKTGDLGKFLSSGDLEFLGRKDRQVKLRGYRIELGEIENELLSHEHVLECIMDVRQSEVVVKENKELHYCVNCGLPSNYPDVSFNDEGVCDTCTSFESYKEKASKYFKSKEEFVEIFEKAKPYNTADYDCLMLLSGGKDSTYVLYQLVRELGLKVLVFSFDNGFISEEAKGNIRRVTAELKVDLIFGDTEHMNEIFVDSLKRHSNVCHGCFKTIYTLSVKLALDKGIRHIVTGLSRGQLYETRLNDLYNNKVYDVEVIDDTIIQARKAYHRIDDAVSRLLDVSVFKDEDIFNKIQFVDFFRYHDVKLEDMYDYLGSNAPWIRPSDTGRSTNCLINDLGIFIHKKERGYHNYALPYAWDVRMGHKTRKEALAELDDKINKDGVTKMLREIGYDENQKSSNEKNLIAYLVAKEPVNSSDLRSFLAQRLPEYMIPSSFIILEKFPLTSNGKVDIKALGSLKNRNLKSSTKYIAPGTSIEKTLAKIWEELLGISEIGINDSFFEIGGHSIKATQIISSIYKELNTKIELRSIYLNPTIASLAKVVASASKVLYESIRPVEVQEYYNLSPAQRRLWILDQIEEDQIAYNIPGVYIFNGDLKRDQLQHVFSTLLERHESLRTSFVSIEGEPKQKILDSSSVSIDIKYIDLRLDPAKEEKAREMARQEISAPFNLEKGPLLRVALIHLEKDKYIFLFVMHHIISDGWSVKVFINEALELYKDLVEGKKARLVPLTIQYKDFAYWQNAQLSGENLMAHRNFWHNQFQGEIPVLELPCSNKRPAIKTYNGKRAGLILDEKISQRIGDLAKKQEASLFMFFIASINTLFYKYTGQQDIIIGSPISGRNHPDLENQIGFFVNTVPIRTTFKGEETFKILLDSVKENLLSIYANQVYPFDRLAEELSIKRDESRSPLFDIMVVMQNIDLEKLDQEEMKGIAVQGFDTDFTVSKYDITFNYSENEGKINLSLEYNADLFLSSAIDRLLKHYETLLTSIVSNFESPLTQLDLLSKLDKQLLIDKINESEKTYPTGSTIQELFWVQAEETAESVAVIYEDQQLTYQQLDLLSNQLANYLKENYFITNEDLIGIMLTRSAWMITSILSVLKAGAAYVPIDPTYPSERIKLIRNDANLKVLIVDTLAAKEEYQSDACIVISLEEVKNALANYTDSKPVLVNKSDDLAYVIYTSGSTGVPKGVQIEHNSIINTLYWRKDYYKMDGRINNLQIPSVAFDSSVEDIFSVLITGGTLVIPKEELRQDLNYLASLIQQHKVSHFLIVPSLYNALLEEIGEGLVGVECITVAGESIGEDLVNKHYEVLPYVTLVNEYGPTENSVCSTVEKLEQGKSVTIGNSISNVLTYILDDNLQLLPADAIGEICVAGAGVARGYLRREVLNTEKFVENTHHPFYKKLYKTGDLGKLLPDGSIKYLGRKDEQVKIRGNRIELGEIENTLLTLPSLDQVVVVAKIDADNHKYLAAYYTSKENINEGDLQKYLIDVLPFYMIPARFIQLDQLPFNANGKIDRKTLQNLDIHVNKVEIELPIGPVEEALVKIWEALLVGKEIGTDQNFFDLGGDSIKATQIVARMYKAGYKISVRDIFKNPTIKLLGKAVNKVSRLSDQNVVEGIVPMTPIQKEFFSSKRLKPHHYNQGMLLVFKESLKDDNIKSIFNELIKHHDALRICFKMTSKGYVQINNPANLDGLLEVVDLRGELDLGTALEEKCNEVQSSIDLENGSLIKLCLFKLIEGDALLVVIHHLVIDGISWRIILEDFSTLFEQAQKNKELSLPLKTDSFKLWSENLQEYANSKDLLKEISYWEQLLPLEDQCFAKDFDHDCNILQDAKKLTVTLDKEETGLLLTKVNFAYNTEINDILLTGLGISIKNYFKQDEFTVALENHGREEILGDLNVSRTIGWFTSVYPLKVTITDHDIARQIKEVKETLRKVPNKGIGYGILKHLTGEENKIGLNFEVRPKLIFNYLGQFDSDLNDSNFQISSERIGQLQDLNEKRDYDFDINGLIAEGQLVISITFNKNHYRDETIQGWLDQYKKSLNQIIYHCSAKEQIELTPSDTTYNKLSIDEIELLESIFKNIDN